MKKCFTCQIKKPFDQFGKDSSKKDGYTYCCKLCKNLYERLRLGGDGSIKLTERKQKDGLLWCNGPCQQFLQPNDFTIDNSAKTKRESRCKKCMSIYTRTQPTYRLRAYKKRAKKRNLLFELTLEDFINITSGLCTYCGSSKSQTIRGMGIDRVNSSKGYNTTNSVPCCKICNFMKQSLTENEFKIHIKKVCNHLNL